MMASLVLVAIDVPALHILLLLHTGLFQRVHLPVCARTQFSQVNTGLPLFQP